MTAEFHETLKIGAYGSTQARKTLQIAYLIDRFGAPNVRIVSCERGLSTIESRVTPDMVRTCNNLTEFRAAWKWADEFKSRDQFVCIDGGTQVFRWVRDELWAGAFAALEQILSGVSKKNLDPALRAYAVFISSNDDIDGQKVWMRAGMKAEQLMAAWTSLQCSQYWNFWEEQSQLDQYRKGLPWVIDLPGNGPRSAVIGKLDYICRLTVAGDKAVASFRNSNLNFAKQRADRDGGIVVPEIIAPFNLADFVELVRTPEIERKKRAEAAK